MKNKINNWMEGCGAIALFIIMCIGILHMWITDFFEGMVICFLASIQLNLLIKK